jgi:hypothetical protein
MPGKTALTLQYSKDSEDLKLSQPSDKRFNSEISIRLDSLLRNTPRQLDAKANDSPK